MKSKLARSGRTRGVKPIYSSGITAVTERPRASGHRHNPQTNGQNFLGNRVGNRETANPNVCVVAGSRHRGRDVVDVESGESGGCHVGVPRLEHGFDSRLQ